MTINDESQHTLNEQLNRERGVEFGRREQQEDQYATLAAVYKETFQESLGLSSDRDEELNLFDARFKFRNELAKALSTTRTGRTSDTEKVAQALGLSELAENKNKEEDKTRWNRYCDTLFSLTLHELLRHVIQPMTCDHTEKEASNLDNTNSTDEETDYSWTPQIRVNQSIWEACLLEITLQMDGAWGKAKILRNSNITREYRAFKRRTMLQEALKDKDIDNKQGLAFAGDLSALVMASLEEPLFEIGMQKTELQKGKYKGEVDSYCLKPTQKLMHRIENRMDKTRLIYQYSPLLIKPRDWGCEDRGLYSGGYYATPLSFYKFPSRNAHIDSFLKTCDQLDYSEVFTAVNALQQTPWRINAKLWDTVQDLIKIAKSPQEDTKANLHLINTILYDETLNQDIECLTIEQRKLKATLPGFRYLVKGISYNVLQDLLARKEFYFVYQADTRGRLYPKTGQFSPQGEDLAKALLEFACAKPLTADGVSWLAQHGSQQVKSTRILQDLGIHDRTTPTLEERRQWIDQQAERIQQVANEPSKNLWWMEPSLTKKPFSFLAFCFVWADYLMHGDNVLCALLVHVDGTCNGLQHIAAMTGDSQLAETTNVLPGEPHDIYQKTAELVRQALNDSDWLNKKKFAISPSSTNDEIISNRAILMDCLVECFKQIDRDIAKGVVMIIPYGAGEQSYIGKVYEGLYAKYTQRVDEAFCISLEEWVQTLNSNVKELLRIIAKIIGETFNEVLQNTYPAIKFFKKDLINAVAPLIERNIPLLWVTPSGFCVLQRNFQKDTPAQVVSALFGNKQMSLSFLRLKEDIDKTEQRTGIVANFIHSFDATHLVKTICLAQQQGVNCFSAVHDSYATHPADMHVLSMCLRQAFIDTYHLTEPLVHFEAWCKAVVYIYDHPSTEEDYGGFEPIPSERHLLELVRQWRKSIKKPIVDNISNTKSTKSTKSTKNNSLTKHHTNFELQEVLKSDYFFS